MAHALTGVRHSPQRRAKNAENAQAILRAWPSMSSGDKKEHLLYLWWSEVLEAEQLLSTNSGGGEVLCWDVYKSYYDFCLENNYTIENGKSLTTSVGIFLRLVGAPGLYRRIRSDEPVERGGETKINPAYYDFNVSLGIIREKWKATW